MPDGEGRRGEEHEAAFHEEYTNSKIGWTRVTAKTVGDESCDISVTLRAPYAIPPRVSQRISASLDLGNNQATSRHPTIRINGTLLSLSASRAINHRFLLRGLASQLRFIPCLLSATNERNAQSTDLDIAALDICSTTRVINQLMIVGDPESWNRG